MYQIKQEQILKKTSGRLSRSWAAKLHVSGNLLIPLWLYTLEARAYSDRIHRSSTKASFASLSLLSVL